MAPSACLPTAFQLQQVILNLITNAIEAMRAAPQQPRSLRIGTKHGRPIAYWSQWKIWARALMQKTGIRIFEPFFTTKPRGMGLGLSICRSIIEAHGGRLWAAPAPLRGTVFQFTLPVLQRR